ncbi:MAG TPA: hypothetical protein PLM98_09605 [Thiolinea sp.]|nr:hypothetical protein [Thiolinea sp.]
MRGEKKGMCCRVLIGAAVLVWQSLNVVAADPTVLEEDGIVKLVATLQNNPAFTNVLWKVYRMDDMRNPVETIARHTATLNLRPGAYKAVAVLNNKERSRSFQLKSKSNTEVVLSMD